MSLMTRFTTLLKADAHGVVDAVEDRALLLKQHLRDAEAELLRKRAELRGLEAETRALEETRKRLAGETKRIDEDATLALSGEKEELARFAVRKLLILKRRSDEAKRRLDQLAEQRASLATSLGQQEEAFRDLEAKVKGFLARSRMAEQEGVLLDPEPVVADEEVDLEILRRRGGA